MVAYNVSVYPVDVYTLLTANGVTGYTMPQLEVVDIMSLIVKTILSHRPHPGIDSATFAVQRRPMSKMHV